VSAKAVVVFDANGNVVIGAEVRLQDFTFPNLTNNDGYALSPRSHTSGACYVRVLANGFSPAVYPVSLDSNDQEVHLGGPNNGGNTVYLPPLSFKSAPVTEPTREQVCNVFVGFQGIFILTKQFGWIPAFGPECGALTDEDTVSYCAQMRRFGFTHVEMDISWRYVEPGYAYPVSGLDLSQNLLEVCRRMNLIINQGMMIKFALAGDGMSINNNPQPGQYNDPQGWTYGHQWLMANLGRIISPMTNYKGRDLTKWTIFVPGYDAVFYGWGIEGEVPDRQPQRVIDFGNLFRAILPTGYLGIEHSTGKIPVGESGIDWTTNGPLDAYDTLLSEYDPFNLHSDNTWQILGRCTRPYNRPTDQPAGDDPNPPYIIEPCSRGERFYIMYELLTYLWVRGLVTIEECNQAYDYFVTMAPNATICMVRQNPS
jgi:hypothetical protein